MLWKSQRAGLSICSGFPENEPQISVVVHIKEHGDKCFRSEPGQKPRKPQEPSMAVSRSSGKSRVVNGHVHVCWKSQEPLKPWKPPDPRKPWLPWNLAGLSVAVCRSAGTIEVTGTLQPWKLLELRKPWLP